MGSEKKGREEETERGQNRKEKRNDKEGKKQRMCSKEWKRRREGEKGKERRKGRNGGCVQKEEGGGLPGNRSRPSHKRKAWNSCGRRPPASVWSNGWRLQRMDGRHPQKKIPTKENIH